MPKLSIRKYLQSEALNCATNLIIGSPFKKNYPKSVGRKVVRLILKSRIK